jgi:hypothetical protein
LLGLLLIAGLTVAIPLIRSLLPEPVRQAAVANSGPIESRPPELAPRNPAGEAPAQAAVFPDPGPNSGPTVEGALGPFSVHVNATPWASVRVDGIDLGATPIANIPLLAGSHSFTAQMSDGRVIERVVEIDAENRFIGFE